MASPQSQSNFSDAGVYLSAESLIAHHLAAKDLHMEQRRRALSLLTGPNKTSQRGRGIDFEEVRAYQAGDDIRTIDWRVTARTGSAYTKLFQEERERPAFVVVDQRQPMFFGSQRCFKSVLAGNIASLIAWSCLSYGDRVGGLIMGNEDCKEIRPRRNRKSVLSLIQQCVLFNRQLNLQSGIGIDNIQQSRDALAQLQRTVKPGSAIYLISDFAGFNDEICEKQLYQLAKHCEITAFFTYDKLEKQLPARGRYAISDGSSRALIDTSNKTLQQQFSQTFQQNLDTLHNNFAKLGIPLIECCTDTEPLSVLRRYFGLKKARQKKTSTGAES